MPDMYPTFDWSVNDFKRSMEVHSAITTDVSSGLEAQIDAVVAIRNAAVVGFEQTAVLDPSLLSEVNFYGHDDGSDGNETNATTSATEDESVVFLSVTTRTGEENFNDPNGVEATNQVLYTMGMDSTFIDNEGTLHCLPHFRHEDGGGYGGYSIRWAHIESRLIHILFGGSLFCFGHRAVLTENLRNASLSTESQFLAMPSGVMRSYPDLDTNILMEHQGSGYLPQFESWLATTATGPRDVVILIDTSGSMKGEKLKFAKIATGVILESMTHTDRAAIISFSNDATNIGGTVGCNSAGFTRTTYGGKVQLFEATKSLSVKGRADTDQAVSLGLSYWWVNGTFPVTNREKIM